jgi:hypothetical protein
MISIPCPDRSHRRSFPNRPQGVAGTSAALAPERFGTCLHSVRLAQPKEPMAVPVRARHRFGDLRQAAKVLAVPGETFFQDHDALELALPLTHQQRAGPQGYPIGGLSIAPIEGSRVTPLPDGLISQQSPHRLTEISESGDLQAVTQQLQEQPSRQMRRRFAAEVIAPLSAKAFELETFEAGKDYRQRNVG